MKCRIIILIIIIKRLGEILLSYMANTSHTHARTHTVSMYFPSQHFMILLVDDVVSSRRPITPEIHLLSPTMFTQEALVTLICMNLSVSYPNWYELKWYACANYLWVKNRICGQRCSRNGSCLHLAWDGLATWREGINYRSNCCAVLTFGGAEPCDVAGRWFFGF